MHLFSSRNTEHELQFINLVEFAKQADDHNQVLLAQYQAQAFAWMDEEWGYLSRDKNWLEDSMNEAFQKQGVFYMAFYAGKSVAMFSLVPKTVIQSFFSAL